MRARGVTITELVVVMALLGGLMSMVALFMQRGRHFASDTEVYSRVQREATQAVRRMTDDLSSATTNTFRTYGDSVAFLSSRSVDPSEPMVIFHPMTGRVVWRSWVCYYYDPQRKSIVRADLPLTSGISEPGEEPNPDPGPDAFRTQASVRRKEIAQNVSNFNVIRPGETVRISVTCQDDTPVPQSNPANKTVEVTVHGEVHLIN